MEVELIIPGKPQGKARPRVTRYGTYNIPATQEYEARVRKCWEEQAGGVKAPAGVPVFVMFECFFQMPKSWSKKKKAAMGGSYCLTKPDFDNIEKIITDALNGIAYPDDSAIQSRGTEKLYTDAAPRVIAHFLWEESND